MDRREIIRNELEDTLSSFQQLLDSLSDDELLQPSRNKAWTIGEVLHHTILAIRFVQIDIRLIRKAKWIYRLVAIFPKGWFDYINVLFTRREARRISREILASQYLQAHKKAIRMLDTIKENEWDQVIDYPDWDPNLSGVVTVERVFKYLAVHFKSHAEQIKEALPAHHPSKELEFTKRDNNDFSSV